MFYLKIAINIHFLLIFSQFSAAIIIINILYKLIIRTHSSFEHRTKNLIYELDFSDYLSLSLS